MQRDRILPLSMILSLLVLSPGIQAGLDELKMLHGSVWFKEKITLPPAAEILVTLEDVSLMDVSSKMLSAKRLRARGSPPYEFTLEYDPALIDDRHRYSHRVRIEWGRKLRFISTVNIDPFSPASGDPVKVLVSRTGD
jgi:putative lipoprotein